MFELAILKKNKINLSDYNSRQDMESRIMLADFTELEHQILEELLYRVRRLEQEPVQRLKDER